MKEIPTDLKKLMTQINKKYQRKEDRPVTMFMTEDFDFAIDTFTTGSLMLDLALGRGGIPRGYIIELFGEQTLVSSLQDCRLARKLVSE